MLDRLGARFAADSSVSVIAHDMDQPLPQSLGTFDAIVSSFAIHHLPHPRKRALYKEVYNLLGPRGVFCNLEHVASPTPALHEQFLAALQVNPAEEDRVEQAARPGDTARLAPGDRLRRRRLPLEVAGTGAARGREKHERKPRACMQR